MSYFKKNDRRKNSHSSSQYEQAIQQAPRCIADDKKRSDSRHSYLKAFKKYYIDKLLDQKCENRNSQNKPDKENFKINDTKSYHEVHEKQMKPAEKEKTSVMTDSTKNSRAKSTYGKISQSKIATLVKNNDCQLEALLYGSISDLEKEMMKYGESNDLAKENKLLRNSIANLKLVLKEKLEVALKKNKEELTTMFEEYSTMIKKLLEDKQALTNSLESWKIKCTEEERKVEAIEQSYVNQIRIIVEENNAQTANTKQQIEEFLEVIEQYEEEAEKERMELQNLREKLVELQMQNDRLKNERDSSESTKKITTINDRYEHKMEKYAQKIESLLQMLEELQAENQELTEFLKSCKCSRIQSQQSSTSQDVNVQSVISKYEKELMQNEKEYIKGEKMMREALTKKDECIDRLNLVIEQLRVSRFASVDKITQEMFEKHRSQKTIN